METTRSTIFAELTVFKYAVQAAGIHHVALGGTQLGRQPVISRKTVILI